MKVVSYYSAIGNTVRDSLRIIFAGTPVFAAYHLDVLIHTKHQVVGVFTQPDRPAGRGNHLTSSPVKQLAQKYALPVFQPISLRELDSQQIIKELNADIMVVVAYGLILPQEILNLPQFGCINVHGSLLPRWRGAAPIQKALWAGEKQTGVTIIQMDSGLDTGPILHKVVCAIQPNDTSASLYNKLAQIGSNALLTTLSKIEAGFIVSEPQDNTLATYTNKISKKDARLDWRFPAVHLERCIRAFNPWPVSYFTLADQTIIKVWSAIIGDVQIASCAPGVILNVDSNGVHVATGEGVLVLTQLQLAGRKVISVHDLLHSRRKWFIPGNFLN